jgi:integrase
MRHSTCCAKPAKRVRRTVYGWTKKEVQDKLTGLQSRKLDGSLGQASKTTVAGYLSNWLENAARPTIRATTHENYKNAIDKHIAPLIGGILLSKLTPMHFQGLYAELERNGASAYTRALAHAVMHRAFKQVVKWGTMVRNVCDAVDPPRIPKSDIKPLDAEQAGKFLEAAKGTRLEALFVLAIGTGMRSGELYALQWSDVDLDGQSVMVRHTLTELRQGWTLSEPKTAKSKRRITLPAMAAEALHEHRKRMLAEGHAASPWVFCNTLGATLRRSDVRRYHFKPLLKLAGLPNIKFHDLRHSHATLGLSAGVHPKVMQERLGHSQISVTMDTYSHVMPTMQRDAANSFDGILTAAVTKAVAGRKLARA